MVDIVANVCIERCDAMGSLMHRQNGKGVTVELTSVDGKPYLVISTSPKKTRLPFAPPLAMMAGRLAEGMMTLRFMRVPMRGGGSEQYQIMLSACEPSQLMRLRDAINAAIARSKPPTAGRQPFAPLCRNLPQGRRPAFSREKLASSGLQSAPRPSTSNATGNSADSPANSYASASTSQGSADAAEPLMPLSSEQQHVLDQVMAGRSMFFTGCAGTGKSLLLRHIMRSLPPAATFATASTGLAACMLGGTTLNAFAGVGRAEGSLDVLIKMASRPEAASRWRRAQTLIIDEVSMVDGKLFDTLEAIARAVRGSEAPFGGIQLVLAGDFHQLPPVAKGPDGAAARRFAFEAAAWSKCVEVSLQLVTVHRQADMEFVNILASVRNGSCSMASVRTLQQRCGDALDVSDGILPTKLHTHREDVDAINAAELAALDGESARYFAQDTGSSPEALRAACPARGVLELKVGSQVMLIRNISSGKGLVNGARGVVQRFAGIRKLPVVRFANGQSVTVSAERWTIATGGRVVATRSQIPLKLGWAMSVHKSQGMTLDRAEVALGRAFEAGMAYVALSRVKSLAGLRLVGSIHPKALTADPKVLAFYRKLGIVGGSARKRKREREEGSWDSP